MKKRYHYITPEDYQIAEKNGIPAKLVEQRAWVALWDIDRAISTPKKKRKCFDSTWDKWKDIAVSNGVDRSTLINRIRSLGWDEESAASVKPGRARSRGKWTEEEIATAERNGVAGNSMSLVKARIKIGWSKEDALNTPKMSEAERLKRVAEGTRSYHKRKKAEAK